jgi:hypothetical protein
MRKSASISVEIKALEQSVINLRECGVYLTPGGKRLVASRFRRTTSDGQRIPSVIGSNASYFLFSQYHWAFHGEPDYEVSAEGELMARQVASKWSVGELVDTGVTAGTH